MDALERAPPRRRNAEMTRCAILDAARVQFAREGYDAAGVREIAAEAGVNAALVCRYFGGKEELFREVLALASRPEDMFCGDPAEFSARIADMMVSAPRDASQMDCLLIMLRSASSPHAAAAVRRIGDEQFYAPIARWLGGPDAMARARLLGAVMMGMGVARSIDADFQLAPEERACLREKVRAMVHAVVTNELTCPAPPAGA